jgi:Zn-dependent protease/predicted transcriptional regulator
LSKYLKIRLHSTWILAIALITAIVATQFSETYSLFERVIWGIAVSLLFLAALILRELILGLATYHKEIPVSKVTLFVFGGVNQVNRDAVVSSHLPLLYLAKFLSNLVITAIFYGLYATFINADNLTAAGIFQWLTYIYFWLFMLHFIPAYPLDGGRILRLILWKSGDDYYKATKITSWIGWAFGLLMVFAGVLMYILSRELMISLFIVLVAWILVIAAGHTRGLVKMHIDLQGIVAEDVMTREFPSLSGSVNIKQLIRDNILKNGWNYLLAVDEGKLNGILTLGQLKSVSSKRWDNTTISDIMTPADKIRTAQPRQTADTLFEEMNQWGIDYIPVLENDKIAGVVSRFSLMNLVKVRSRFGV